MNTIFIKQGGNRVNLICFIADSIMVVRGVPEAGDSAWKTRSGMADVW